jgi:hypothetical protein
VERESSELPKISGKWEIHFFQTENFKFLPAFGKIWNQ